MAEIHPVGQMLDGDKKIIEPYFHQANGPEAYRDETDYCDRNVRIEIEYGWRWSLGDTVNALIGAGLTLEYLHEFPFSVYEAWPTFVRDGAWWYYPDRKNDVPLTFSIKARK